MNASLFEIIFIQVKEEEDLDTILSKSPSVDQMHLLDTLASCSTTHFVMSAIDIGASKNLSKSGTLYY